MPISFGTRSRNQGLRRKTTRAKFTPKHFVEPLEDRVMLTLPDLAPGQLDLSFFGKETLAPNDEVLIERFAVRNDGTAESGANPLAFTTFRLSKDSQIDTTDLDLGGLSSGISIAPNDSEVRSLFARTRLPNELHPFWDGSGTYYIGSIVDPQNVIVESDESNNASTAQDGPGKNLYKISVKVPLPDLVVTPVTLSYSGQLRPSKRITIGAHKIRNLGRAHAGPFSVGVYLSDDPEITTSDYLLRQKRLEGIVGNFGLVGEIQVGRKQVNLPDATSAFWQGPGTYYIGAVVDSKENVDEDNESNNQSLRVESVKIQSISSEIEAGAVVSEFSKHLKRSLVRTRNDMKRLHRDTPGINLSPVVGLMSDLARESSVFVRISQLLNRGRNVRIGDLKITPSDTGQFARALLEIVEPPMINFKIAKPTKRDATEVQERGITRIAARNSGSGLEQLRMFLTESLGVGRWRRIKEITQHYYRETRRELAEVKRRFDALTLNLGTGISSTIAAGMSLVDWVVKLNIQKFYGQDREALRQTARFYASRLYNDFVLKELSRIKLGSGSFARKLNGAIDALREFQTVKSFYDLVNKWNWPNEDPPDDGNTGGIVAGLPHWNGKVWTGTQEFGAACGAMGFGMSATTDSQHDDEITFKIRAQVPVSNCSSPSVLDGTITGKFIYDLVGGKASAYRLDGQITLNGSTQSFKLGLNPDDGVISGNLGSGPISNLLLSIE